MSSNRYDELVVILPLSGQSSRLGGLSSITTKCLLSSCTRTPGGNILGNLFERVDEARKSSDYSRVTLYIVTGKYLHYYEELMLEVAKLSEIYSKLYVKVLERLEISKSNFETVSTAIKYHRDLIFAGTDFLFVTGDIIYSEGILSKLLVGGDSYNSLLTSNPPKGSQASDEYFVTKTESGYLGQTYIENPNTRYDSNLEISTGTLALTRGKSVMEFLEWHDATLDNPDSTVEYVDEFAYQFSIRPETRRIMLVNGKDGSQDYDNVEDLLKYYRSCEYDKTFIPTDIPMEVFEIDQSLIENKDHRIVIHAEPTECGGYPIIYSSNERLRGGVLLNSGITPSKLILELNSSGEVVRAL